MAIKFSCEICGAEMGTVNIKDLKQFAKKYGDKCGDCIKMETELKNFVESKKALFMKKFNDLVIECRTYMMGEIQGMLEKRAKMVEMRLWQEDEERKKSIIKEYENKRKPKEPEKTEAERK